jgi:hypothetical protein
MLLIESIYTKLLTHPIEELLDVLEAVFSDSDGAGGPLPSCLNCSKARRTSSILMAP